MQYDYNTKDISAYYTRTKKIKMWKSWIIENFVRIIKYFIRDAYADVITVKKRRYHCKMKYEVFMRVTDDGRYIHGIVYTRDELEIKISVFVDRK